MQYNTAFADWEIIPSGTKNSLYSVHFPSNDIGFAVGAEATVLKSVDNGNTWMQLNTGLSWESFQSVYFINDTIGFITGYTDGKVLKTINGGDSWTTYVLPTTNNLNDIEFIDDSIGLIVGYREIWKTVDQGKTWVSLYANQNLNFPVFYSVEFLNKDTIFIAGEDAGAGRVLKTTTGGEKWDSQIFGQWMRFDVEFVNDTIGYTIGSNSDIYKTVDGGAAWLVVANPGFLNNIKMYFINDTIGYAVGYDGRILSTKDGGMNWANEISNTNESLQWIYFINKNQGFVVGTGGIILKISNTITSIKSKDDNNKNLKVFPSPSSSILNINVSGLQDSNGQISIFNELGGNVFEKDVSSSSRELNESIPISELPNGLYFVSVQTSTQTVTTKFIILH
jgi:Uncharacterized protein related to plant photosystem II stability/assembly factor